VPTRLAALILGLLVACPAYATGEYEDDHPSRSKARVGPLAGIAGKGGAARSLRLFERFERKYGHRRERFETWPHLTGDWGGLRTRLDLAGFELDPGYTVETATIISERLPTRRTAVGGLLDLTAGLRGDSVGLDGGKLVTVAQLRHGIGATEAGVGDIQTVSNIGAPELVQLSGLWYRHRFADDRLWFKIGKQDANLDFAALETGAEMIQSSFGLPPLIPLPTYPDPGWGVVIAAVPIAPLTIEVGAYEAAPVGDKWLPTGLRGGVIGLAEATLHTSALFGEGHGGSVHVGGWGRSEDGTTTPGWGVWAMLEQPVWARGERFIAPFAQWAVSFGEGRGGTYLGGGLLGHGLWAVRPDDTVALGVARLDQGSAETAVEAMYKLPLLTSTSLTIDVQYVHQPSGRAGEAIVGLLRVTTLL